MTTQHYIFLENVRFYSYHGVAPPVSYTHLTLPTKA